MVPRINALLPGLGSHGREDQKHLHSSLTHLQVELSHVLAHTPPLIQLTHTFVL